MTVLDACSTAGIRLRGKKVVSLFSSTEPFLVELTDLVNETARGIADEYDWQALTKSHTLNGTGAATSFALPDDFDRMPKKGEIHSGSWNTLRFVQARDLDQWRDFQTMAIAGTPGRWIILGSEMQILPAISSTETAKFYYISRNVVKGDKPKFTADGDEFMLDERLLTLGLIWRWRAQKRFEYAEDMANYELALSKAISRDKGTRPLVIGNTRLPAGVEMAFPGTIIP